MASPELEDLPSEHTAVKIPEKTKTTMSKEIFEDFQRFLKTENKNIEGMTKSEVKTLYSEEYKLYRSQITPDQALPTFYKLFRVLFQQNLAHFEDDKICLGPIGGKVMKRPRSKGVRKINDVGKISNQTQRILSSNTAVLASAGKTMAIKQRMAVDQHLTFKMGTMKVIDMPDFKGDAELWKHISKTRSPNNDIYYCAVCQSKCNSSIDVDQHVNGKRHRLANTMNVLKSKK